MNILVTGANGQLGNEMRIVSKNTTDHYIFTDVNQVEGLETTYLDITDMDAIRKMVKDNEVQAIVNCAAWTNVDACETDEKLAALAEKLNADAPENLAQAMKEVNGLLVQISTDYVFDGTKHTPYSETDPTCPDSVYGRTKLEGEQLVIQHCERAMIVRTAWLYSIFGNNFVKTMIKLGRERDKLGVVFDQIGTPTYARDLARAIMQILAKGVVPGVYHFTDEGVASWYDFTKMIHKYAGIDSCKVSPLHTSDYPTPATRPHYSVLDKTKIKKTFDIEIPYWADSVKECVDILLKQENNQ